jgi:tetratricopeptide (TPR) repeat protein
VEKLIMELRRRHVFRATGLHVGIAWIVLQGADLLLPAFEAPAWVFRALVIVAFAGAPLTAILAWIYEYTEHGFERQETVKASDLPSTHGRQMDFIVIGVLLAALSFSVYLNLQDEPIPAAALAPVSILIADFDNETGDPVFDSLLEEALTVGLESAPFVTTYDRHSAASLVTKLDDGAEGLDVDAARQLSVKEGIKYVLAGTLRPNGSAYALSVVMLDPADGEAIAEATAFAKNKSGIFGAVGSLAGQIRAALGDASFDSGELPLSETFTAASVEAASDYSKARVLVREGSFDEALEFYQRAIDADPNIGRAFAGYALALFRMGRREDAEEMWQKAEFSLDTMTERERLHTLAGYHIVAARNYQRAQDTYERLAELYPADSTTQNNLAIAYFMDADYERAKIKALRLVEIYPKNILYRSDLSLYAMYAGDFATAAAEAQKVLEQEPGRYQAHQPLAIAALATGDVESAVRHYRKMVGTSVSGNSRANMGLADTAIFAGKFEEATTLLTNGMRHDRDVGMTNYLARKAIMLASILTMGGSPGAAQDVVEEVLEQSRSELVALPVRIAFPAAHMLIQLGQAKDAADIADELGDELQPYSRAYGKLIEGMLAMVEGDSAAAIELAKQSIDLTDLWLGRFHLGVIYLEAGYPAEALLQFELCEGRIGEASSLFLDDMPTWRYTASLNYWKARAHEAIDMRTPAIKGYQTFLALRPEPTDDPLAADAYRRVMALTAE